MNIMLTFFILQGQSSLFWTPNKTEVLCSLCMKVVTIYLNKKADHAFPNCMHCMNLQNLRHSLGKIWVGFFPLASLKILLSACPQKTATFSFS